MTRVLITTVLFCALNLCIGQNRWEQVYGLSNKDEYIDDITECYDRGYFVISSQGENEHGLGWGIKTDVNGNILWERIIGGNSFDFFPSAALNDYGDMILVGVYRDEDLSNSGIIVKLDSCGDKQWCSVYTTDLFYSVRFVDAVILDNSDILVLGWLNSFDINKQVYLFYFNNHGELLWYKPYAIKDDYPQIDLPRCTDIVSVENGYILSGWCYWLYPGGTYYYQQPLIIKVDSLFNEEWILPYGVNDSILGKANATINLSDDEYLSCGVAYTWDSTGAPYDQAWLMRYDLEGNETISTIIPNDAINPPTDINIIKDFIRVDDTIFLAASIFGNNYDGYEWGEYTFDLEGNIYNYASHDYTRIQSMVRKTFDGNYLFGTGINFDDNFDIMLYKLNDSLEPVPYDTSQYTYDSLCPHPIQSDTISLEDCMLIVNIDDIPGPEEYYARLRTIPLIAYPNPAKEKIFFELGNTQHHKNITLQCYNIFGRLKHKQEILAGQLETEVNIASWHTGLYVAVVRSGGKITGKCKFVVF